MRKYMVLALWTSLVSNGLTAAQNPDQPTWTPPSPVPSIVDGLPHVDLPLPLPAPPPFHPYWINADFVRMQARTPLPIPLVTTGDPNDGALAGSLGRPGTKILYGAEDYPYTFTFLPGVRTVMGIWLDPHHDFGIEQNFLFVPRQTTIFRIGADTSGNPPIYLPAFNVVIGREDSGIIADPRQQFTGNVAITNAFQMWGGELNGLFALVRHPTIELHLLTGARYLRLKESLEVNAFSRDLQIDSRVTSVDRFGTNNQFLGGQLGLRGRWQPSLYGFELTGKIALGNNQQTIVIEGENARFGAAIVNPTRSPGGFYTQPTNIGTISHAEISAVPTLDFKADYQCTPHIRLFFNYGFIVFTHVVRPGNEIDRNLNLSKSPVFGVGPPSNIASPAPLYNRSTLFIDGISIGLEIRF